MSSSREGLEIEIRKLLSEVTDSIDVLSSLEMNKGNVVNTVKDIAMLNNNVIGNMCKEAIVTMRKGVDCERALLTSLRRNKINLKSHEIINLFELMSESSKSTRHLLKVYPNIITEEFTHFVRFKVKKMFDKLTMLLALSFLFPIILALTTLFHKVGMLDVILIVLIFQLLLRETIELIFHQSFKIPPISSVIIISFLPMFIALTYALLSDLLKVILYSLSVFVTYYHIVSKSGEKEKHTDLSEEVLYFELIRGLSVNKSVEQILVESVKKIPSVKRRKLMNIVISLRHGKGPQKNDLMKLGFNTSIALKASLRGRKTGKEALNRLLKTTRVKRMLIKEIELELGTINFRAKITSSVILISLILLTFTNIYLLPIGYSKLKILCLTYMNSALLFDSSVEFFSLLFGRRRALKWGILQLILFFTILSILSVILTGCVM